MRIDTKTARAKLEARREPYWHQLRAGGHLGYRQVEQGEGTWIAKWRDAATGKRHIRSLGTIIDSGKPSAFEQARRQADAWIDSLERGASVEVVTVGQACAAYAESLPEKKAARAKADFRRLVDSDPIAQIELQKLQSRHVADWRARMVAAPARIGRGERVKDTPKSDATINRDMVGLRAALRRALDRNEVDTDRAWRVALRPITGADRQRDVDLSADDRRKLLDATTGAIHPFVQALATLPVRPGALAALTVAEWDRRTRTLHVKTDKAGAGRRIIIPKAQAAMFDEQCRDKLPSAPIFPSEAGGHWSKDTWKKPIAAAAAAAGLPASATAYALRHSVLSDMVTAGADMLTIAKLAGTSVSMLEKHYGHLRHEHAAAALAKLAI